MFKIKVAFGALLFASIIFIVNNFGVPTSCVKLPNGINIGKNALIDFGEPYFRPDIVPKLPNGKPLIGVDAWPFYVTRTSAYGVADHRRDFYAFAWRADTGIVVKSENPELYNKIVNEAGNLLVGHHNEGISSHIIMRRLQRKPQYSDQKCTTYIFTW